MKIITIFLVLLLTVVLSAQAACPLSKKKVVKEDFKAPSCAYYMGKSFSDNKASDADKNIDSPASLESNSNIIDSE